MTRGSAALSILALVFACGGDDGGGGNSDPDGGGGGGGGSAVSIQEVQDDAMAVNTAVRLEGVVVTAIDTYGGRTGAIYVQEPEGGAFSGIVVNTSTVPSGVEVGSLVDVSGVKDEFALNDDESGRTMTQIGSPNVTVVGTGTVPDPEVVDPRALAADDAEAEKWEGVLVTFENVAFEGLPRGVTDTDELLLEARVTGPFRVQSGLTAFPDSIGYRDCYASITGIGDYFFDYKILPRSAADFAGGGDSCPEPETGAACTGGADDDADGYADCEDYDCYAADADTEASADGNTCAAVHTVVEAQDGTVEFDTVVEIEGVVTARHPFGGEVWIQQQGGAGEDNGLHVEAFRSVLPDGELPGAIDIGETTGKLVTVAGVLRQSFGETVVTNATVIEQAGQAGFDIENPPLADFDSSGGDNLTSADKWEARLVAFSNVEVTEVGMFGQFTISDGVSSFRVDDTLFSYELPSVGACYEAIVGIVIRNTFEDEYMLAPRREIDLDDTGGTCN